MDLIEQINGQLHNLLPYEGTVYYYGSIMPSEIANEFYNSLIRTIQWENDEAIIYGKKIITKRKVAWYATQPFTYTYSKVTKTAKLWISILDELKAIVEKESGETYNSCLLNLYHDGNEGMAWHSDAERDLKKNGAIGSLSFGAERKFSFKHKKTKEMISTVLQHGSLLVMKGTTQSNWLHRLPPTKKDCTPRVNLTFRTIATG
ncbi:alpha-ketoglutarate-dependent dioxygenase AlkB [uncultured Legionella sp.]|uniref:alpha-ketoglutarate-dependent dioxygenase AlkB family protein n=1 Tax=uncultured Legionella sp. TaxID=210934 RepID=UPI002617A1EF|nr:alpha-ketoglutarate-dependent dioxygenase AlkB [uncultured Legionella sp.]